jgi:hypothetical protein
LFVKLGFTTYYATQILVVFIFLRRDKSTSLQKT